MDTFTPFRSLLSAGAFALLTLVFSPVYAEDGPMMGGMRDMDHMGEDMPMMKELNLTDKQKEAMRNAMKQRHESMQQGREFREQMRDMTDADQFDEKKLREMIRKHNKAHEDSLVKSSKAMHDFHASLSAEQKAKLDEKREHMKSQMKDHMKDGMKERHGHHCDEDGFEEADDR